MSIDDRTPGLKKRRPVLKKKPARAKRRRAPEKPAGPGRPAIMGACKLCGVKLGKTELRLHEPACRREHLLKVGARGHIRLNNRIVPVEIQAIHSDGSMSCLNLVTGNTVGVRSGRRFREWMDDAVIRFQREPAAPLSPRQQKALRARRGEALEAASGLGLSLGQRIPLRDGSELAITEFSMVPGKPLQIAGRTGSGELHLFTPAALARQVQRPDLASQLRKLRAPAEA